MSGYTLTPWYGWSISYYVLNFQSTTGNGPVIRQLYFRQALAYLTNQASVISGPLPAAARHEPNRAGAIGP